MSKYKLINKTTGEEHLCDKVTIDGFDYYVSDAYGKPAIATNNPNIDDVPKVVDEVERLANEFGYHDQTSDTLFREGLILGYEKSQEEYPFTEEDVRFMLSESFKASQEGYEITSDEIIKIFQEQKIKIIYYND